MDKRTMEKQADLKRQLGELRSAFAEGKATDEQRAKAGAMLAELNAIEADEAINQRMAQHLDPVGKIMAGQKRAYNLGAVLRFKAGLSTEDIGYETEIGQELRRLNPSVSFEGIAVPISARRASETTTSGAGGVIATQVEAALPYLYPAAMLPSMGVREIGGLVGDITFPVNATDMRPTAKGEIATADAKAQTVTSVKGTPHRLPVTVKPSKQFLLQTSQTAEAFLQDEISAALGSKMDLLAIQGTGADAQPLGLLNWTGVQQQNNANNTWIYSDATSAVNKVLENNPPPGSETSLGWLVRPAAAAFVEAKPVATNAAVMVAQNGLIAGYNYRKSTNMPASTLVYGPWSQMLWLTWGALDLVVDPYTGAKEGIVEITASKFFDSVVLRPTLFIKNQNAISA